MEDPPTSQTSGREVRRRYGRGFGGRPLPRYVIGLAIGIVAVKMFMGGGASRARALRTRILCAGHLQDAAAAASLYGGGHPGGEISLLDWLVESGHLTLAQTLCPAGDSDTSNYVLIPPSRDGTMVSRMVVAFEPKSNHGGEGGNVVFADGHAEFARGVEYDRLRAEAVARKGEHRESD